MDRKKELKQQYKETTVEAGVFQIKNKKNEKIFIGSTPNFKTLNGVKFMLQNNGHRNKELQEDWNQLGQESFTIEVLEKLKRNEEDPYYNEKEALGELEEKWLEQLQPFGDRGYNQPKSR